MEAVTLAVISDLHHYSRTLGDTGRAYALRSGGDQKALAESGAVIDTVFARLAESQASAVLIAGDLTNDGERASHEEIREKLRILRRKKPVYLITSTHDWCTDSNARRYVGDRAERDVETLGAEELASFYDEFGRETLLAEFRTAKGFYTRCYQAAPGLRLIAVNDDMDGAGGKSGYSPAHLDWMRSQLADAAAAGDRVIAMEHHLMLYHLSPLINKGQSIADHEETASALADAGLRLLFVGHSHMQRNARFVSPAGNALTQVNVGALCGYPAPVVWLTAAEREARIRVECLRDFTMDGRTVGADFFRRHTEDVLLNLIDAAATDKRDCFDRLNAQGIHVKESLWPVLHTAAKKLRGMTVGQAGRLINSFTFGKGVDRQAVAALKDEPLLDQILTVFLSVFDGSAALREASPALSRLVLDVGRLPARAARLPLPKGTKASLLQTARQIEALTAELVSPAGPDNRECGIPW